MALFDGKGEGLITLSPCLDITNAGERIGRNAARYRANKNKVRALKRALSFLRRTRENDCKYARFGAPKKGLRSELATFCVEERE